MPSTATDSVFVQSTCVFTQAAATATHAICWHAAAVLQPVCSIASVAVWFLFGAAAAVHATGGVKDGCKRTNRLGYFV